MKRAIIIAALLLTTTLGWSQAKKPTIMVVPSDAYCERNGYVQHFKTMGDELDVPDYAKALKQDVDMRDLIAHMAEFMAQNNFPLQSLEQELKRLQTEDAEMAMMTGKTGSEIDETPVERLRRNAKADIILDLDYQIERNGPRQQVRFNLQAIDAYSSKIISGNTGLGTNSGAPLPLLLGEVVESFKDNFLRGLQNHFDDMFRNGREVTVTILKYGNCPFDFDDDIEIDGDDYEFRDWVEEWFQDNTKEGRFSTDAASANRIRFTQVRIPLYSQNRKGRDVAIDANDFVKPLVREIKQKLNVPVGATPRGLGDVWITVGDK
ncbi:MAG: hypothetical protein J6X89_06810 [Bacteroidales bacterium]|nr:hypothetical protein [Bacteroidales bacterium]